MEKTCYEQRTGYHPQQWTEECCSSSHVNREYTALKGLQRHNATDSCHQEILRPDDCDRDWFLSQVPNRYTRENPAGLHTEYTHGQDTQRHSGPRMEVNFQPSAPLSQRLSETTMTAGEQPTLKTHMVKLNKYNGKTSLNTWLLTV
jgi:hypothetical protein